MSLLRPQNITAVQSNLAPVCDSTMLSAQI